MGERVSSATQWKKKRHVTQQKLQTTNFEEGTATNPKQASAPLTILEGSDEGRWTL